MVILIKQKGHSIMALFEKQLERVRRYYNRFKTINNGRIHSEPSETYLDDIYTFFMHCYHLKDWLKKDPAYIKHTDQEIENYVSNTLPLAISADICNCSKHLLLDRPPRSGDKPRIGKKTISVGVTDSLSGQEIPTTIKIQVEVEHAGNKLDAFQLATDALKSWEVFI
jgi:hypothetical protein